MLAKRNLLSLFIISVTLVFSQDTPSKPQPPNSQPPEIVTQCAFLDVQGSYDINAATADSKKPQRVKTTKVQNQAFTWPEGDEFIKRTHPAPLTRREEIRPIKPIRPSGLNATMAKTYRFCNGTFDEHIVCLWAGNATRAPPLTGYKPGWYTEAKIEVSINGTNYQPYTVAGFCTFPKEPNVLKDCAQIVLPSVEIGTPIEWRTLDPPLV